MAGDWATWLADWNRELLERLDPSRPSAFRHPLVTPELVRGGWLGRPGATQGQIAAAEERLGVSLPPSYRSFLETSDGFLMPDLIVPRLRGVDELRWLHDEQPETVETWSDLAEAGSVESRLSACLQISDRELVGTATMLLDPHALSPDGEWQAIYLAHWSPGAEPFASFRELMDSGDDRSPTSSPRTSRGRVRRPSGPSGTSSAGRHGPGG